MPRANRYHVPGLVWHITHRCHDRSFLLKWAHDRDRYRYWLFEAKKRYGLKVLTYIVTSNHVHLLLLDNGDPDTIEDSLQFSQGRLAQEYNRRKERLGAYWQDRYHATAVQTGKHLRNCIVYIDLNMVRAGKVMHPSQWRHGGYLEITQPRKRYQIINLDALVECSGFHSMKMFLEWHEGAIIEGLQKSSCREVRWTESVAVGDRDFLNGIVDSLGIRGRFLEIHESEFGLTLEESPLPYRKST